MSEPANSTPSEQYGISTATSGIVAESETITKTPLAEAVPNQTNATTAEIKYDERTDLKLTYRGTKLTVTAGTVGESNDTVTYNNVKYYVDSHEDAGSYNGLKRYNLNAHRFTGCPA